MQIYVIYVYFVGFDFLEEMMSIIENIIEECSFIVHSVGHTVIDKNYKWNESITSYPYYRIYYVKDSKKVEITLNNEKVELLPNKLYLFPPYSISKAKHEFLDHYWIHFHFSSPVNNLFKYFSPATCVDAWGDEENLFNLAYGNYNQTSVSSRLFTSGVLKLLVGRFLGGIESSEDKFTRFEPVINYIEKNLSKQIILSDLAEILYLNKVYFSNEFKRVFGVSPNRYINNKRLDQAKKLLLNTNKRISEITAECGFNGQLYFSRFFKEKVGVSPLEYRKLVSTITEPLPTDPR